MTVSIAIVGVGKIARDEHLPAIAAHPEFELAATVSRSGGIEGVQNHPDIATLLATRPDIDAVALCMPPMARFTAAKAALRAGRHVMLEKPPGATVAEALDLECFARETNATLFATWHSRHAAGVATAREWLSGRAVRKVRIDWKEDVRKWHPGQAWIWEPGGLGVFDPGINALSIMTEILPVRLHLREATLEIPENRATPIAADLTFDGETGIDASARFDWRERAGEVWQIAVETDEGSLLLSEGGARLAIDGAEEQLPPSQEYPSLYDRFARLIADGQSDVDLAPLIHVADAFMLGRSLHVEPFEDAAD